MYNIQSLDSFMPCKYNNTNVIPHGWREYRCHQRRESRGRWKPAAGDRSGAPERRFQSGPKGQKGWNRESIAFRPFGDERLFLFIRQI